MDRRPHGLRGADWYNEQLSERRAEAVRSSLISRGIGPGRFNPHFAPVGLGVAYPTATNDTAAGRQENRRVEIVISDQEGDFPDSVDREIASR